LYFWDPVMPDVLEKTVEQFNAENEYGLEIVARVFPHPNDLETAVTEAIAAGSPPVLVLAEPYQYLPWHDAGVVVELSPYVESAAYGLDLDSFYPAVIGRDLYTDGRLAWMIDPSPGGAAAWLLAFDPWMRQRIDFKTEGVEAAYTFLSDLSRQGCAWSPTARYPDDAFVGRLGLFYAVSNREIGYVAEAFEAAGSLDNWTAVGYPNPEGEPVISLSGRSYVILQSEIETQVAAWQLIKYLAGEVVQTEMAKRGLYLPLDTVTASALARDTDLPRVWRESLPLLDNAVAEPPMRYWGVLRSVLQDAQAEVVGDRFVPGNMGLFLDHLDTLARDLQSQ
jgi:ABC-type glycerol-3-phosphate transport system substrate-binding protein